MYLKAYAKSTEARRELRAYFRFYNDQGAHLALGYRTPAEVFHEARNATGDSTRVAEGPPDRVLVIIDRSSGIARLIPPRSCPTSAFHLSPHPAVRSGRGYHLPLEVRASCRSC